MIDQVNNTSRQSSLQQYLHKHRCTIHLCIGRLPHHHITTHSGRSRQVTTDSRKVERRNRQYEPFQRTIFHPVMNARRRYRLLVINARKEVDIKSQKVDQLTSTINLSLVSILALSQHSSRIHPVAVLRSQQFCSL